MNGKIAENETAVRSLIDDLPLYMAFSVMIYAPVVEELVFRKFIYGYLSRTKLHIVVNIIIVAFISLFSFAVFDAIICLKAKFSGC